MDPQIARRNTACPAAGLEQTGRVPRAMQHAILVELVVTLILVGIIVFAYLMLIKDMAIYRDAKELRYPAWKGKLYNALSLGYSGTPKQDEELAESTQSMSRHTPPSCQG